MIGIISNAAEPKWPLYSMYYTPKAYIPVQMLLSASCEFRALAKVYSWAYNVQEIHQQATEPVTNKIANC